MKILPLPGRVLVELIPRKNLSAVGLELPEVSISADAVQATHRDPSPPPAIQCLVRKIGSWPKNKNGMLEMPEFGVGSKVLVGFHSGIQMERSVGEKFKMILQRDVLAILTESK